MYVAMNEAEREALYDSEIAPVLMELARKCEGNGLSFLAMVEWSPGENGRTVSVRAGAGIALKMALWAMQAQGNADALIMAMQQDGREHGHNSVCLAILEPKTDYR
jgi:hypothetical protein